MSAQAENGVQGNSSVFDDVEFVKREWEGRQADWLLQWLIDFVGKTNTSIGVTLSIGGSLVAGELISHKAYFEQLSVDFSGAFAKFEEVDTEMVKKMIMGLNAPISDGDEPPKPQFLHLKGAKTFTSVGGPIAAHGTLWRGKVTAVDGFTLGNLITQN